MTIGDTIVPSSNPNLYQSLLSGVKTLELIIPKTKKSNEMEIAQILISFPL